MQKINLKNKKGGYTIIETMIAVSLFVVIVTIGMGALLNANVVHRKTQDMRSIVDNLSFVMEDISRNLRTGQNYHCGDSASDVPASCSSGGTTVYFKEAITGSRWGYRIQGSNISKSTDGGTSWKQLNLDEVLFDASSEFIVTGAEPPPDEKQPFVTIKLSGKIQYKGIDSPFALETGVSQRLIDEPTIP